MAYDVVIKGGRIYDGSGLPSYFGVELAKKEGRVNFYTSMGAEESKVVADAFQAKYPAIRVDITRLGSEKLLQRVITEGRAGSHFFDAVTNSGMEIHLLGKMGLLARLDFPQRYSPGGIGAHEGNFRGLHHRRSSQPDHGRLQEILALGNVARD